VEALKTYTTKVCSFPSFFNQTLHEKILAESGVVSGSGLVKASDASAWWSKWCENKCPGERLWALLRGPNSDSVTRDDWKKNLASLLDTHPGLDFLKSTPEFQASPLLSQPRANQATLFFFCVCYVLPPLRVSLLHCQTGVMHRSRPRGGRQEC